jgi:hypothetical protein
MYFGMFGVGKSQKVWRAVMSGFLFLAVAQAMVDKETKSRS